MWSVEGVENDSYLVFSTHIKQTEQVQGTNLAAIHQMFRLPFKPHWIDPKWNFQHVSNFTDNYSYIFKDRFLHLIHIFQYLAYWWTSQAFDIFDRGHITVNKGMGWNSIVGMATHYQLDGRGQIPVRETISTPAQIGCGTRPASYTMGTGSFLR